MNLLHFQRHCARRGFSLVELMIGVAIISLLIAVALPAFLQYRKESANSVYLNQLRVMKDAFKSYHMMHNSTYPADVSRGNVPPEMGGYFPSADWNVTPIGGKWDWDAGVYGIVAAISVADPDRTDTEMESIDSDIDDGDLYAGSYQKIAAGRYAFIIEE